MAMQQRLLRDALARHLRRRPLHTTRNGLKSTSSMSTSSNSSYDCRRYASTNSNNTSRGGMKYVTSDTIDKRLLQGLTAASDESRPVNLIQDKEGAKRVLKKILELGPAHFHACDTEVGQIDIKAVGPVGNGKVQCIAQVNVQLLHYVILFMVVCCIIACMLCR